MKYLEIHVILFETINKNKNKKTHRPNTGYIIETQSMHNLPVKSLPPLVMLQKLPPHSCTQSPQKLLKQIPLLLRVGQGAPLPTTSPPPRSPIGMAPLGRDVTILDPELRLPIAPLFRWFGSPLPPRPLPASPADVWKGNIIPWVGGIAHAHFFVDRGTGLAGNHAESLHVAVDELGSHVRVSAFVGAGGGDGLLVGLFGEVGFD